MTDPSQQKLSCSGAFLFGSEAVSEGQADKLCDRVADAVVEACLAQDPDARVACDAVTKTSMVMVLGEVVTKATVNYEQVIREAVRSAGYDSDEKGLDWRTMNVIVAIDEQTPDLTQAITAGKSAEDAGLGDQGVVFGYATDETPEMMPLSHILASKLCARFDQVRKEGSAMTWARPDARAQVLVEYRETPDGAAVPLRIHTVTITASCTTEVKSEQVEQELMAQVVKPVVPEQLVDASTIYQLLPAKPYINGGTRNDSGASGRRGNADTYGGWVSHGNGSLSGRDPLKAERVCTYGARWAARSLVAAGVCKRCLVQLSYSPSSTRPASILVHSYGTAKACGKSDEALTALVARSFDFRPGCLQRDLNLKGQPGLLQKLSSYGHLGRSGMDLPWEKPKELK